MKKNCFLFVLLGTVFYSPPVFSDNIVNIGIKSKMSQHVLSNCRFASALALDGGSVSITYPGNTKNASIAGLRQSPGKLPDTYRASKAEFDDKSMMALFGQNVKYSSEHSGEYPAVLFKDWTVTEFADTYAKHYNFRVGMTLFSTLPAGVNAATIFNKGEVNFAYRMTAGQGQLECDIYDLKGKLLGLVDYVTDSGPGSYKALAIGDNSQNLNLFSLDAKIVRDYGSSYPKKRILLTMSDDRTAAQGTGASKDPEGTRNSGPAMPAAAAAPPAHAVGAQYQSKVSNMTDNYVFRNCTRHDTHGSWIDSPSKDDVIRPGGYFTFVMKSKGHGIQGEIRCTIHYQPKKDAAEKEAPPEIEMGRLLIEIDNDGTAFALFPFINDPAKAKQLVDRNFRYTLYVETNDNYSITVRQ